MFHGCPTIFRTKFKLWAFLKSPPWSPFTLSCLQFASCVFIFQFLKQAKLVLTLGWFRGGTGKGLCTCSCHCQEYSSSLHSFLISFFGLLFKCHQLKETLSNYSFSNNLSLSNTHSQMQAHMYTDTQANIYMHRNAQADTHHAHTDTHGHIRACTYMYT